MIQMQNGEHSIGVSNDEDMPLVDAARRGELGAFEQLIRRYDQKVFRLARHITQNHQDAEDAAQDAFLKAFRGLSRFEGKARFSTWLFRIAVNESLMRLRHRRRTETVSLDEDTRSEPSSIPFEVADWRPNPEQLYDHAELKRVLAKALQRVPEKCRTVFLLRDVEGLSTADTALALNVNAVTVKARLLRARLRLRELLGRHFQVPQVDEFGADKICDSP